MNTAESVRSALRPGRLFLDGRWEEASGGRAIEVCGPATGEVLTRVPDAGAPDIDRAVAAARSCFEAKAWRGMDPARRERILWDFAEALHNRREELAVLISLETGKTVREAATVDVAPAVDAFRYYAGWARTLSSETVPAGGPYLNYTVREPAGVVGVVVSWNHPLQTAAWKVAPALACGCSVVLKPSELTPLSALKLAECAAQAGLPDGALNVVTGYGETAGEALVLHEDVDRIAFTGSTATARRLMEACGESNLKRISLELRGRSPNIVFPDCDWERALKACFGVASTLLVHESVYEQFVGRVVETARNLRLGDPLDRATQVGSQISSQQMDRILDYVRSGVEDGARLLCGGERDTEGVRSKGFFVRPAVFSHVAPAMRIARQDIVGPVVAAIPFRVPEDAVRIANAAMHGPAAAVWTRDIQLAHRMASELRVASVWINAPNATRDPGSFTLEQYTTAKSVWVAL